MKNINGINGSFKVNEMGLTLIHEHLLFQFDRRFKQKSIDFTKEELFKLKKAGGKTLVDLTPFRDIHWYEEIASGVDLNLVVCTGYYIEKLTSPEAKAKSYGENVERMEKEILEGIDGTKIKAGIIKVAGDGAVLTPWEEEVFKAAARAQLDTKSPIATHACTGSGAQQKVLLDAGANPGHIFFSHVEAKFGWEGRDVRQEAKYLLDIAKKGSYLLFNNFGFEFDTPKEELVYILKFLADRGCLDRILISVDMNYQVNEEGVIVLEASDTHPECSKRVFSYLITDVIPVLYEEGFSKADVDSIFNKNPERFFNYI